MQCWCPKRWYRRREQRPLHCTDTSIKRTKVFEDNFLLPLFHTRLLFPICFRNTAVRQDKAERWGEFLLQTYPIKHNTSLAHELRPPWSRHIYLFIKRVFHTSHHSAVITLKIHTHFSTVNGTGWDYIQICRCIVLPNRTTDPSSQLLSPINVVLL